MLCEPRERHFGASSGSGRPGPVRGAGVIVALAAVCGAPPLAAQHPSLAARVDSIFTAYDTSSPGCAVGVIRHGVLALARGYGMANLEHGIPITPRTVFRIGSTSKQFTAAVVLLLAEDGTLALDDDVRSYLPELPGTGRAVTIRHLLHHTSGVRDYLVLMTLAGKRDDDFYTVADVLALLARQRGRNFEPGAEFLYSNSGYFLLSQVVQRAGGRSLRALAEARVFRPLGMADTHFHDDHTEIVPRRATGYAPTGDGRYRVSMTMLDMVGDGGVFTTVEDLARWDANFDDPRIGAPDFVDALLRRGVLAGGDTLDYALGLVHGRYRGLPTVGHGGAFVGFRAQMLRFPTERFTVICLCNLSSADPNRLALRVADAYLADVLGPPEGDRPWPDGAYREPGAAAAAVPLTLSRLAEYAGAYHSEELGATYRIVIDHTTLGVRVGNELDGTLEPAGPDRFARRFITLRFERDASHRVTGFALDAGRVRGLRFRRVETR